MLTILSHGRGLFTQHLSITFHSKWEQTGLLMASTCISWMIALNWGDRSVHCFSSSMALSKFFTYSAYIFRKGVSFCRMSPIRGVEALQEGRGGSKLLLSVFRNGTCNFIQILSLRHRLKLTILPCVSPDLGAKIGCERCGWRRCWRRCSSPHPRGMSLYLPPPLTLYRIPEDTYKK